MKPFDVYSVFDIEIKKAKGSVLWDYNGTRYLDLYGGHAVISIGHSHPHYVSSIAEQLGKIGFYSNSVKMDLQEQLSEKLGRLSGYPDYSLFLCNSGAEANENAFKLASFHNGRKKIIAFTSAFHGRTSLAVSATDNPRISAPVNQNEHVRFLPLNDICTLEREIDDDTCAVIVEGIQGVSGVRIPSVDFLKALEKQCREKGVVLILDEVQSGYGRSGKFFAHQYAGIKPDLITIAKGMGNGFPVGGVLISPNIKARKEMLGTTFGGNYLACTAALAVLHVMETEDLIESALEKGHYLISELQKVPRIKELRSLGLMTGIELYKPVEELRKELLFKHFIFTGSASDKHTIRILPSLTISTQEIDLFVDSLNHLLN
jgi:acetylornithine aminotransferase